MVSGVFSIRWRPSTIQSQGESGGTYVKFLTPDQIRIFDGGQIQKVEPRWNDQVSEAPDLLCLVVETTEGRSQEIEAIAPTSSWSPSGYAKLISCSPSRSLRPPAFPFFCSSLAHCASRFRRRFKRAVTSFLKLERPLKFVMVLFEALYTQRNINDSYNNAIF